MEKSEKSWLNFFYNNWVVFSFLLSSFLPSSPPWGGHYFILEYTLYFLLKMDFLKFPFTTYSGLLLRKTSKIACLIFTKFKFLFSVILNF